MCARTAAHVCDLGDAPRPDLRIWRIASDLSGEHCATTQCELLSGVDDANLHITIHQQGRAQVVDSTNDSQRAMSVTLVTSHVEISP